MVHTNGELVASAKDPATEVSFLIRSSEDALRIAETLKFFSITEADNECLAEVDELLSLVRHWDAPLTNEAWNRISALSCEVGESLICRGSGEEPGWYDLIANALNYAAQRKLSCEPSSISDI